MALKTRKPTGRAPWPIILLAGGEKSGKSWSCAEASGSDLIDRTLWISLGEDDPDEYGAVPGARFEIVEHDGTYRDVLRAVNEAADEPAPNGKPNLLVLDSGGQLWTLLSDMAQAEANRRAAGRGRGGNGEADIHSDLWNTATARWYRVINALRRHRGPVIVTARLEETTLFDAAGKPTKEKTLKVKAQKGLPYDVGAIVQLPKRGEAYLTGVRSVLRPMTEERVKVEAFTVEKLWRYLGLDAGADVERAHSATVVGPAHADDTADAARDSLLEACTAAGKAPSEVAALYEARNGRSLRDEDDPEPIRALVAEISPAAA